MAPERLVEFDQPPETSSRLLQEEALSGFYEPRRSGGKEASASIGYVAREAPKLGAWSALFSCTTDQRRGRRPQRYAVQVAKVHPSGARSATPSQTAAPPPAAGQRPFVGPPLTLPPAALEAAVNKVLEARESRRGSPDRAPSAPLPERRTPAWQRFPCLKAAGVPCDSPAPASSDMALTAPAALGRSTPSRGRGQDPPPLPFKAGTPRPRLLERKFGPAPPSAAPATPGAGAEQGPLTREALAATLAGRSTPGIVEKFDLLGQQQGGRGSPGTAGTAGTRVGSPSAPGGGSQAEDVPGSSRSARHASIPTISTPRGDACTSPGFCAAASPSPTPTGGRRLRFRGSDSGEGAEGRTPSPLGVVVPHSPAPPPERNPGDKKSPIWRLNHKDTKGQRLERLNSSRKARQLQDSPDYHRDRISRRWEIDLALESFHRYFEHKTGNDLDLVALKEALGDFGLKARTRPEKLHMQKVFALFEESPTLAFSDFCTAVEEARAKLRSTQTSAVFQAWKRVDLEDFGALDQEELIQLLEVLDLHPKTQQETLLVRTMVDELNCDANGLYAFHEAEFLVAWAREHGEANRRRLERGLQETHRLEDSMFEELRSQILELHASFVQEDEDDDGLLDREEVLRLLADYGFMSGERHRQLAAELFDHLTLVQQLQGGTARKTAAPYAGPEDESQAHLMSFPGFLSLLLNLRDIEVDEKRDDVQALFSAYDFDCSGELNIKETCRILVDLRLQPRSPSEQESIAQLLEEVDSDGSGQLNVEELTNLAQRIGEKVSQLQRRAENERAEALGFSKRVTGQLRHAFEVLDIHHLGVLGTQEVEMAVHLMGWKISPARLQKLISDCDDDNSGRLDFPEFLLMMRHVEDEMRPPGSAPLVPPAADDAAAHAAHGLPHGAHGAAGAGHGHGGASHALHGSAHSAHGSVPPTPSGGAGAAAAAEPQEQDDHAGHAQRRRSVAASNFALMRRHTGRLANAGLPPAHGA